MADPSVDILAIANDAVRIGSYVAFYSTENAGFVYSDNPVRANVVIHPVASPETPDLPNIKGSVFEIMVPHKYKMYKKLAKLKKALGKDDPEYSKLQRLVEAELRDNELEQARQRNRPVVYGQAVQLRHVLTNRYLYISSTEASRLDILNMQVSMADAPSKHTYFRIMPRFKVRSEGDVVRIHDQIVVESLKTSGQFIHAGGRFSADSMDANMVEVDLSVQRSSFVLYPHITLPPAAAERTLLRGGDVLCLVHKELDSYLTAEGTFTGFGAEEDVHFRARRDQPGQQGTASLFNDASITWWQVELDGHALSGEAVAWEQNVRLRHMCTRKYLCLVREADSWRFTLTEDHQDRNCIFRLHRVVRDDTYEIFFDSYARIEHAASGMWLHGLDQPYRLKQYESAAASSDPMDKIEWDGAKLRQISASREARYDDAFALVQVPPEYLLDFNFVAGLVRPIEIYVRRAEANASKNEQLSSYHHSGIKDTLKALSDFMFVEGVPVKSRQKLLRHLRVVDSIVLLLKAPFKCPKGFEFIKGYNPSGIDPETVKLNHPRFYSMAQECYSTIANYLSGSSRKNELYIAKYISFFQSQLGYDFGAANMLLELVRDNRRVLDRISEQQVESFIFWLKKSGDPAFLNFLNVLCVCNKVAVPKSQQFVFQNLLREDQAVPLLYKFAVTRESSVTATLGKQRSYTLEELSGDKAKLAYVLAQVELMAVLCTGRNETSASVIRTRFCDFEACFQALCSDRISDKLRRQFGDLLLQCFVDVEPNAPVLNTPQLNYVWKELSLDRLNNQTDGTMSLSGQKMAHAPRLREFIISYLRANKVMTANRRDRNSLTAKVLQITKELVLFGYYPTAQLLREMLGPLLDLLDGASDQAHENQQPDDVDRWQAGARFEKSADNKSMYQAKLNGADVVDVVLNFVFNQSLFRFLAQFKELYQFHASGAHTQRANSILAALSRDSGPTIAEELGALQPALRGTEPSSEVVTRFLRAHTAQFNYLDPHHRLPSIFYDLARYKYSWLTFKCTKVLNRYYSHVHTLFEVGSGARLLLTDESIRVNLEVLDKIETIRRLNGVRLDEAQEKMLETALARLTALCSMEDDILESHPVNVQIILRNGILPTLLDVVSSTVDVDLISEYSGNVNTMKATLNLLRALCRDNKAVQEQLFAHLDAFLSMRVAIPEMANCVSMIFSGNAELCLQLKESQIYRMVELLAEHQSYEILQLLNVIVRVDSLLLAIRRNQTLVIKYMMQHRDRVILLVNDDENEERNQLLVKGSKVPAKEWSPEFGHKFLYHVRLVRMLATCCEGDNRFIHSMCQSIFTLDELFETLTNAEIDMMYRRPYLRFLLWAYLNAETNAYKTADVYHMPQVWKLIEQVVAFTYTIVNKDLDKLLETDAGEQESIFLYEAVCPFFRTFYSRFYKKGDPQLDKDVPNHAQITTKVIDVLLHFLKRVHDHPAYGTSLRVRDVNTALLAMQAHDLFTDAQQQRYEAEMDRAVQMQSERREAKKRRMDMFKKATPGRHREANPERDLNKESLRRYFAKYKEELMLNDALHNFMDKIEHAYRYDPRNPQYDPEHPVDGGLPLGYEFQQQLDSIAHYVIRDGRKEYERLSPNAAVLIHALQSSMARGTTLSVRDQETQHALDIKHLRMLRAVIANERLQLPASLKDDMELWEKVHHRVQRVQIDLNHINAARTTLSFMTSKDEFTFRAAMRLLAAMLVGGNRTIQMSLYKYFRTSRDETFFAETRDRLISSGTAIREARALQATLAQERKNRQQLLASTINKMSTMRKVDTPVASKADLGLRHDGNLASASAPNLASASSVDVLTLGAKDNGGSATQSSANANATDVQNTMQEMAGDIQEDKLVDFKSVVGFTELLIRIMQLLCEAQFSEMKDYLREQTDNVKSVNLVREVAVYLHTVYTNIDKQAITLARQTLSTLTELAMGNQTNQVVLFDSKVVDVVNFVLRQTTLNDCTPAELTDLKLTVASLAGTMVEETSPGAARLAHELRLVLDIPTIADVMFDNAEHKKGQSRSADEARYNVSISCYILLSRLADLSRLGSSYKSVTIEELAGVQESLLKSSKSEDILERQRKLLRELEERVATIEVVKDDRLEKVYFDAGKMPKNLREHMKKGLLWSVDRSSPADQIRDFVEQSEELHKNMLYQEHLDSNYLYRFLLANYNNVYYLILLLTFAINILMLATWQSNTDDYSTPVPIVPDWYNEVLYILGGVHIFLSIVVCVQHVLDKPFDPFESFADLAQLVEFRRWYYLIFLGCSIAGIATSGYFYCFHLLHIIDNNDLLKRVLQSVTKNGRALLWVAALGIILLYLFAIVEFAFYRESFVNLDNAYCDTLWQCFVSTLDLGLRGGFPDELEYTDPSWHYVGLRTIYNLLFFIIISTLLLNIVFGIIVDTFSELRDEKFAIEDHMNNYCFICSMRSFDFQKAGTTFKHHIKKEHNMWNYIFFMAYLAQRDETDYTSNEAYVKAKMDEQDNSWFPIARAMCLQQSSDEMQERLQRIEDVLKALHDRFKEEDRRRQQEEQRKRQEEGFEEARDV